ncbi:DMT family transporter [Pseudonocardia sp. KRD-169]|uniref:DMT family transporter n=1 Tax=Pseudonocardia abyssalis TaxID=2792008 RepID=A0ABS6UYR1_9PSEU|nr:DMT family transporter [Pseudonocardia abyssalis]MBW0137361.1 DMT family transporter [Pseudonocardia abyssalis]
MAVNRARSRATGRSVDGVSTTATPRVRSGALLAVVVTVLAWASAFVAIRAVGASYEPGPLALGRLLVGALALGAGVLVSRRWVAPTAREWGLIMLCGIAWFAVYNVALNAAEQRIDAGTTAMLVNVGPILIALFAGLLLGEGFPRWLLIGGGIAFGGVLLVGAATADTDSADVLGVVLCLVAAVTYAVGVLAQKPVLRRLPALQVTFLACVIGAVACLPFTPGLLTDLAAAPAGATAGLVYLGVVPTALAFSTWAYALARMDAGRLGVTTYAVPPITIALSAVLLGELPPWLALVGGLVCLVGVGLSRRR